jgi:2-methylaconitate cis-trans-isomerase PrpF
MTQQSIAAMFMRGGTSKALMFCRADLPARPSDWDAIFLSAMGSPDRHGRQLNGMGGGNSSLSKVCVVGPSARIDADVDYTFAQVMIDEARVDYSINCGNMSSAVGPFAVYRGFANSGVKEVRNGEIAVRIFNTNTSKVIVSTFAVHDGMPVEDGTLEIPGVAGSGAPIRLDFLEPGGATTGQLLPGGAVCQFIDVPDIGRIEVSLVDAANACVFVTAESVGMTGTETPDAIQNNAALMHKLMTVRAHGSVAMGIAATVEEAMKKKSAPFLGIVTPPQAFDALSGERVNADATDLNVRVIASGQPHRALPLTISLCTAVAARIQGSIVARNTRASAAAAPSIRLAMPSGILTVDAKVELKDGAWTAHRGSFYRTTRRLFEGVTFY